MRKWVLLLLLACASLWTHASASGPLPDNIAMLMKCTACERVVEYLNQHFISGWIQKDVKWSKKMKGTFKRVVAENSCANPEVFPGNNDMYRSGCVDFIKNHRKELERGVARRLSPKSEYYQEDLTPKEFCQEIHACPHEMRGLEHQMQDVQRKHAWESAEEREAAVPASRADPTRVIGGKDAADSAVVEDDDEALEL
ncbi:unnamed protein product [Symbiodinium sp. KB8]|nr:unnamed protein product [Symbiodinium sp. KB8]